MSSVTGLINKLNEGIRTYLPESSYNGRMLGECSALSLLTYASIKNIPHALVGANGVDGYSSRLSARVTFLEASLLCTVSMVHNLVFAILYTIFNIGTLGVFRGLRNRCKIHWMHATYSLISTAIAVCGIAVPYYGVGLNGFLLWSTVRKSIEYYRSDVDRFEGDFVKFVQDTTKEFKEPVYNFFRTKGEAGFVKEKKRSLEYIEAKIHSASRMEDLESLVKEIFRKWPKMGS